MRNQLIPALFLAVSFLAVSGYAAEGKNLQVLPKDITKDDLKKTMDGFAEQLGVKCTFCHIVDQYEKDERPHKADARRMIRLVLDMKAKKADYFGPRTKEAVIACGLCHRGKAEPEPFVP
ncbi:MAG: c-type cytochrome [Vicinamibacteria bacterium]